MIFDIKGEKIMMKTEGNKVLKPPHEIPYREVRVPRFEIAVINQAIK
jgi:hypothetical protein